MSRTLKRVIVIGVGAAVVVFLIAAALARSKAAFYGGQIGVGLLVVGVGLFRRRLQRWLGTERETGRGDRILLQAGFVLIGVGFIFSGGAEFLDLPPTVELLVEYILWGAALLAFVAVGVKRVISMGKG